MAMYGLRKISRLLFVISLVLTANVLRAAADESDAATSFMASRLVRSNCSAGYDTESSNCSCETSDYCCDSGIFGRGWLIPDLSDSGRKSLADKHAPAGLMGDHVHDRGEWMFEYKYMNMYMEDNRIGTSTVPDAAAFGFDGTNGLATPTQMTMEMHMMHIMYGLTDSVTLYAMPMWNSLTMDHLRNTPFPPNAPLAGTPFTTHNSGFGDLTLGGMWQFHESECDQWIFNFGFSVPTGDIDRTTQVPTGGVLDQEYPYPMRLGSGTFNFKPAVTYKRFFDCSSVGCQFEADIPTDYSDQGYRVGETFKLSAWYAHLMRDWLALSFRIEGAWKDNYHGADPDLPQAIISTNRPDMRGGEWLRFGYGAMILLRDGNLINAEVLHPVYQDLDGIQLEDDWQFFISWSKAFGGAKKHHCH